MRFDFWAGAAFGVGISLLWSWAWARAKFNAKAGRDERSEPADE